MKRKNQTVEKYSNLYPIRLYVGLVNDWDKIKDKFYFYESVKDADEDHISEAGSISPFVNACTCLVREKDDGYLGILILLGIADPETLAHEAVHYADAVYDILKMNSEGYDEGNEQYAYLVQWCVRQLNDFITWKGIKTTE